MNDTHRVRPLIRMGDWEATDPFLGLMEDWFTRGTFGPHPHRGIETVTYVIEGDVEHRDNQGHAGTIHRGDAQWMTAGRGLLHSEAPPEGVVAHTLQLWINLPADRKMTEPRYQDLVSDHMPVRREPGALVTVFSGRSGDVTAATQNHVPVTMVRVDLDRGARVTQELNAGDNAFVVVLAGDAMVGATGRPVAEGQLAWLTREDEESTVSFLAGDARLSLLLFAGPPLGEPVVAQGPFVMNTEEEIRAAFREYRAGLFGEVAPLVESR